MDFQASVVQKIDAVADIHDLGQLRREDDDGLPLLGKLADEAVYLAFGAHVDAARRLIQHEQVGICKETLGENHLLLVAAGELGSLFFNAVGGDLQLVNIFECDVAFRCIVDESVAGYLLHVHDGHIAADGQDGEQALGSSFLRHQGNARRNCLVWSGLEFFAFEDDLAFVFINTVDGARKLGFAGAHQSVETGDLPRMDVEGNIVQLCDWRGA